VKSPLTCSLSTVAAKHSAFGLVRSLLEPTSFSLNLVSYPRFLKYLMYTIEDVGESLSEPEVEITIHWIEDTLEGHLRLRLLGFEDHVDYCTVDDDHN